LSSMAKVIAITLLTSWVLANCVTPLMCYWFLKPTPLTEEEIKAQYESPMYLKYKKFLTFVLQRRVLFLGAVAALMVGAILLMGIVRKQFMPDAERNQFMVYLDVPAGYGSNAMDHTMLRFLEWLHDKEANPEVESSLAYVGYGGPRFFQTFGPRTAAANISYLLVSTKDFESVPSAIDRTREYISENFSEANGRVKKFWLGANETGLVEVRISGPRHDVIYETGQRVMAALRDIPGTTDIFNDWENRVTKILAVVDQPRARRAGVSSQEIADSLNTFFSGTPITDYREGDKVIPVMFRAEGVERQTMDRLRTVDVYSSANNVNVPLMQVADLKGVTEYSLIMRRNLLPTVTVEAKHAWLQALTQTGFGRDHERPSARPFLGVWRGVGEFYQSAESPCYVSAPCPGCHVFAHGLAVQLLCQAGHHLHHHPAGAHRGCAGHADYGCVFWLHGYPGFSQPGGNHH